jgi:hypothetical protein
LGSFLFDCSLANSRDASVALGGWWDTPGSAIGSSTTERQLR